MTGCDGGSGGGGGVRVVFNVARGLGVVGEVTVGVDITVRGDKRSGEIGVSGTVTVCVAGCWASSISANLLSGAAAAREDLSRPNKLRRLLLDDWRFTGLWRGTGSPEPLVLG